MSEFSDSSVSRTSPIPGGDLQTKYQKIAAEYSKIRAQATVLKKVVVEEQAKNAELQEVLRERDQSLRKADQEMESLTFRNQQLTKRVAFLQDELESCQNNSKKNASKSKTKNFQHPSFDQTSSNVLDMEFKKMVEENAQLLSKMYDSEEEHKQEIAALVEQIDRLQSQLDQYGKQNTMAEEKFKTTILKLEREKGELYETIKLHEQHLKSLTEELVNLNKFKLETVPQLEAALLIIATYLPFVDTSNPKLKCINSKDNCEQTVYLKVKKEMENLTLYFTLFFSSLKKRLFLLHSSLMKDVSLNELTSALSTENDFVFDKSSELTSFLLPLFLKFSKHSKTLLPLFLQSLSEEEKEAWCSLELRRTNQDLSKALLQFLQFFIKISSFIESAMAKTEIQETKAVNQTLMKLLCSFLQSLSDFKTCFSSKEQIEKQVLLGNKLNYDLLNVQSDLQTANINCVHLLSSLTSSLFLLLSYLQELNPSDTTDEVTKELKNTFCSQESKLDLQSNIASLKNVIDAEEGGVWKRLLLEQLDEARKTIINLETERNHLLNEFNLFKLKRADLPEISLADQSDLKQLTDANLIGKLDAPFSFPVEIEAREELMKKYFANQLNTMVIKKQEALSKANTFSIECGVLQRRLELSSEARRDSEKKMIQSKEKIFELNEKLQLTKHSYETQLSTMSDHLANLNEKLAEQTDHLEHYKLQLNNVRRKK